MSTKDDRAARKALKKQRKAEAKARAQAKKGVFSGFPSSTSSSSPSTKSFRPGTAYTYDAATKSWVSSPNSGTSSKWWVSDYGKKKEGESVSSYWTSRMDESWYGYGGYGSSSYQKEGTDFSSILSSVRRSANIVSNAENEEDEQELNVKWAAESKDRNTSKGRDVFLSPSVVDKEYTRKKDWTNDERTDVLIGEALVQSTMKRTIDADVEKKMCDNSSTEKGQLINEIWTVSEHIFAEKQVLENYPGFKGYFASNRAYYTGKNTKENFENFVSKEENIKPETAVAGLAWEMLHPTDEEKLAVPEQMRDFIKWSKERFASEASSSGRSEASDEIVKKAYEIWKVPGDGNNSIGEQEMMVGKIMPDIGIAEMGRGNEVEFETSEPVQFDPLDEGRKDSHKIPNLLDEVDWHGGTVNLMVGVDGVSKQLYDERLAKLSPLINEVRSKLKIRVEEQKFIEHALKKGRLDEGSIYKLGFHDFGFKDDKIFEQEEIISLPKVAFGILVDESGSMGIVVNRQERVHHARDVAIIIANACLGLPGIDVCVWGHTANGYHQNGGFNSGMAIHHYYTPDHPHMPAMGRMNAFSNNLDGYAIAHTARLMTKYYPTHSTRILVHISDGTPAGRGYGGHEALKHVGGVSKLCRSKGVKVVGIGIENAYTHTVGSTMYGGGNFAVLKGVAGLGNIVSNLLVRTASSRE